jgi:catechol 2,3-dioxygenase-like lactoylglutathione lyase family enzyme
VGGSTVVGLQGVDVEAAMPQTPDGHAQLELARFRAPAGGRGDGHAPGNAPGIRHLSFEVDDLDAVLARLQARGAELVGEVERYEDIYRALLPPRPGGDHRRARRADRLRR